MFHGPSKDPSYPLFPILSFLGFLISIIPLAWHLHAWNAGTCAFMIWTGLACLIQFINALIWSGSVENVAPVWCDISTKLLLGAGVAIPAATLCITRRLYLIAAKSTASVTFSDKRRAVVVDLAIAVGIPVLVMILHVIVQPHRFDIFEDIGCVRVVYNTLPAYFLVFMWPALLGLISFVYSSLTLHAFWVRRAQFSEFINSTTSMNSSRYLRLMLLALVDMLFTVPIGIYTIFASVKGLDLAPWVSWEETHYGFGRVDQYPAMAWRNEPDLTFSIELTRWLFVFSAIVFFALFGFAEEAQKNYKLAFWFVAKLFGYLPKPPSFKASLPSFVKINSTTTFDKPQRTLGLRKLHLPEFMKRSRSAATGNDSSMFATENSSHWNGSTSTLPPWDTQSTFSTFARDFVVKFSKDKPIETGTSSVELGAPSPTRSNPPPYDISFTLQRPSSPSTSSTNPPPAVFNSPPSPSPTFISLPSTAAAHPQLSTTSLRTQHSQQSSISRITHDSQPYSGRIYISEAFYPEPSNSRRTPSPPPFQSHTIVRPEPRRVSEQEEDIGRPTSPPAGYHRPISPTNVYPMARPHPGARGMITVEVHREEC